jgi:transcriptional regulator with XRE-family HTH domain
MGGQREVDASDLARRVRSKREAANLSLRAAAKELEMSPATLSRVESGEHLPQRDHLLRLARWAEVPLWEGNSSDRNALVHGEDASTLEAVSLHLRADEDLKPEDAEILVDLVRAAYERMQNRQ